MATQFRGAAATKLLDCRSLRRDKSSVLGNLLSVRGQNDAPSAAVYEFPPQTGFKRRNPPTDRGVFDAELLCGTKQCSGLRERQEMPKVVPVDLCEFPPNHCEAIGNFHTSCHHLFCAHEGARDDRPNRMAERAW
ncbi:hypothetical protein HNR29_004720 [Rhizobium leguminosarum]|nr:hypothetical protein [Rhizobium leguminosarum]